MILKQRFFTYALINVKNSVTLGARLKAARHVILTNRKLQKFFGYAFFMQQVGDLWSIPL